MTATLLAVDGATVRFGGLTALDGVSIDVPQGSITGLIGPNGAGKTTLLNVISGFVPLAAGTVRFKDHDLTKQRPHRRVARGIARSFQTPSLIEDATVLTNVLAAQGLRSGYRLWDVVVRPWRQSAGEARLVASADAALRELGLEAERDTLTADLSFGSLRWTELAGLLASGAELLMLDEPTTGLDRSESERLAVELQRARADGRTTLVVAHDVQFVLNTCDYVHALAEGAHIVSGSAREVCTHPTVVEQYLGRPPT